MRMSCLEFISQWSCLIASLGEPTKTAQSWFKEPSPSDRAGWHQTTAVMNIAQGLWQPYAWGFYQLRSLVGKNQLIHDYWHFPVLSLTHTSLLSLLVLSSQWIYFCHQGYFKRNWGIWRSFCNCSHLVYIVTSPSPCHLGWPVTQPVWAGWVFFQFKVPGLNYFRQ